MGNKLYFLDSDLKAKEVHFGFLGWLSCVSQDSAQLKMINNEKLIPDLYFELSTASLKPLRQKTDVRYSNVASSYKRTILRQKQLLSDQEIPC